MPTTKYRKLMKNIMTRNEAAAYLGVEPQTITNWVDRGLLGGFKDEDTRRFYVNADDVYKYSENYKLLSVSESKLDAAILNYQEECKKIDTKLEALTKDTIALSEFSQRQDIVRILQYYIYKFQVPHSSRTAKILTSVIMGKKIRDIAHDFGLGESYIRGIAAKGLMEVFRRLKDIGSIVEENASLKTTITLMELERDKLLQTIEKIEVQDAPVELLELYRIKISDVNFSVRIQRGLHAADIETIGDLVTYSKLELMRIPNLGKTSIAEIEDYLKSIDLKLR